MCVPISQRGTKRQVQELSGGAVLLLRLLLLGLTSAPTSPPGPQPPGSLLTLALACVLVLAGGALAWLLR